MNSFPTHDVRATGWKFDRILDGIPISLIAANFQQVGTVEVDRHNRKSVSVREGHLLKIWYGTRSNGDGEDVAIDR